MCGFHKDQKFYGGHCEAIAPCGRRCNRLTPWLPGSNQLCEFHEDFQLPCHITRLPVELRLQICDYLIPKGPIQRSKDYSDASHLLRINKQFYSDVYSLLFATRSRPTTIDVDEAGVSVFGLVHDLEISHQNERRTHAADLHLDHLDRITHLALNIDLTKLWYLANPNLSDYLISLWFLAKALFP